MKRGPLAVKYFFICIIYICAFLISGFSSANAGIKKLATEFLDNNSSVLSAKSEIHTAKQGYESVLAKKAWALVYNATYLDSSLEDFAISNSSFSNLEQLSQTLSLSKDFGWGGNLTFSNNYTRLEPTLASTSTSYTRYLFDQSISYTQDLGSNFFGRDHYRELDIARNNELLVKANVDKVTESSLLVLYLNYIEARLNKTLVELQKKAHRRAIKRRKLIARRVRDGLREKVDLFQAQMAEHTGQEGAKSAEIQLNAALGGLSEQLHRYVKENEVNSFYLKAAVLNQYPVGGWKNNKDNISQQEKINYLKNSLTRVEKTIFPTIQLEAEYHTNNYDGKSTVAISGGSLGEDNDEYKVGVTVAWPISFEPQTVERAKLRIQMNTTAMENRKAHSNFVQIQLSLREQIKILDGNIRSVESRRALAEKVLREYNKLYNLGRADLDQVIRAEESLIQTETNFAQYLSNREMLLSKLALLYGNLDNYLQKIRE